MSRMQAKIIQQPPSFAGIDVGKSYLDVFIHPEGKRLRIQNNRTAISGVITELARHNLQLVALEATGTYHRLAHTLLHEAGLIVAVINPYRARQFADSLGRLAKTDMIDAQSLAFLPSV